MEPYVDERLLWRALRQSDLEDLASLRAQIEVIDDPVLAGGLERLIGQQDIEAMEHTTVGGWDSYGNLLAYGWNVIRPDRLLSVHLLGGVHPTHRYLGIGRGILAWQVASAVEHRDLHHPELDLWLGCYVDHAQPGLSKILSAQNFTRERFFYDMHRELTHLPKLREVDGVEFEPFTPDHSEAVRRLHNVCFADPHGRNEVSREDWDSWITRDTFRPEWSWIATFGGDLIGYALSGVDEVVQADDEIPDDVVVGWTGRLGVAPDHRGRGVARAMLTRTLHSMARGGCAMAGLGVDTTDPASPGLLTEELGYEARDGLVLMSRFIPA